MSERTWERIKEKYSCDSTEELFGITEQPDEHYDIINDLIKKADVISELAILTRKDDTDNNDFLRERLSDIGWESVDMDEEIDRIGDNLNDIREWGQGWKDLAKKLILKYDINISDFKD